MKFSKFYYPLLFLSVLVIVINRLVEYYFVSVLHEVSDEFLYFETMGLITDLGCVGIVFLVLAPLFLFERYQKNLKLVSLTFIFVYESFHVLILKFFLHDLTPLDVFLYKHTLEEILFTVSTSNVRIPVVISMLFIILITLAIVFKYLTRVRYTFKKGRILIILIVCSILLFGIRSQIERNNFVINKTNYFLSKSIKFFTVNEKVIPFEDMDFQSLYPEKDFVDTNYIFLSKRDTLNSVGKYLNGFTDTPNVVILVVEGLNNDFVNSYHNLELMPFLTSLKEKSLYWNKCFTLGERSFAVIPSITGGLPYGRNGFTFIDKYPKHTSLVSVLEANDFQTSFFYGQGSWFHHKDKYFKFNNIDNIIDNGKYSDNYKKIMVDDYFWGYNDKDLFKNSLDFIDSSGKSPRLDIYFTGTSHAPYVFPNSEEYKNELKRISGNNETEFINKYELFLSSLLFVDESIEEFLTMYKSRPNYENTIFIITGDHPCTELPRANELKRYHVPLFIYSPRLSEPRTFNNIVSHLDVSETVFSIMERYMTRKIEYSSSLGKVLTDVKEPNNRRFAFMDSNRDLIDFYSDGYFISGEKLFWVGDNFELKEIENPQMYKKMRFELDVFNAANIYVCDNDRLIPDSIYFDYLNYQEVYDTSYSDVVVTNEKWSEIIPNMKVTKTDDLYLKLSLENVKTEGEIQVIIEVRNNKDEMIFWRNIPEIESGKDFKIDLPIPLIGKETENMMIKCLMQNQDNEVVRYSLEEFKLLQQR